MIKTNLFHPTDAHKIVLRRGNYAVLEYLRDLSVKRELASSEYFAAQMNYRKRQVICQLDGTNGIVLQAGEMQMIMGDVEVSTNVTSITGLVKSAIASKITKETAIKPRYTGTGLVILEPSYNYILVEDLDEWGGTMVISDGMFLVCDDIVKMRITNRHNVSSTVLGNAGFFNTELYGKGMVVLESPVPESELMLIDLEDDIIKIDGNIAIAWSGTLDFTVEKTTDTILGSLMSKEVFLNVYSGTGRILVAPVRKALKNPNEKIK